MSMFDSINKRFNQFRQKVDLKTTNIIAYMVLEKAGALYSLKDTRIHSDFLVSALNENPEQENTAQSTLSIEVEARKTKLAQRLVKQALLKIGAHFKTFATAMPLKDVNTVNPQCTFSLSNQEIYAAVESSALVIAAGYLHKLSLDELIELKGKIKLYPKNDEQLNALIQNIQQRVENHILNNLCYAHELVV
ncbi:hypothetical protein [Legionella worsleiensis]|uniref:Uncharacterized protein n=1 Tax=Legionella worsleiensis TaxID=45076 RepID=A0A0W1A693_9GAMM|nr:hypothetical protein [Legionella worsleiensis]KTD76836.1 hypothetical protein Lwor_2061 [Legionella worsleiensis]STY30714.1 Uncharacterised protein [Legionella worsleiensis]